MRILLAIGAAFWLSLAVVRADTPPKAPATPSEASQAATPVRRTLRLGGDTRSAYTAIGIAFGVKVRFDSSVPITGLRLDLDQVTCEEAMNAVALVTRTFWTSIATNEVLIAADNAAKRKELERWVLQTFYLPDAPSTQQLTEVSSLLKTLFDLRVLTQSQEKSTITVRGPAHAVESAEQYLETLRTQRPQVMLEFQVYDVTQQTLRDIGIATPSQFTLFLIQQSTINSPAGSTVTTPATTPSSPVLAALLSQAQQSSSRLLPAGSIKAFGGGQTVVGVNIPPVTASFSENKSTATSLSQVMLRGSQGKPTTFRLGDRYPVTSGLFATGTATLGSFPAITYEDLGISVKVTPTIHQDNVTLDVSMELSALGSQLYNSIPTISSRRYSGSITVRNEEPAVVAGSVTRSELMSLQGLPGISLLPGVGRLTSHRSTQQMTDELLVIITPHIIGAAPDDASTQLVLPPE